MKTQHTQGEWVAFEEGVNVQGEDKMHEVRAYTPDGQLVMICQTGEGFYSEHGKDGEYHLSMDEALANARLIAAAPLMYAKLENIRNISERGLNGEFTTDYSLSRIFDLSMTGAKSV